MKKDDASIRRWQKTARENRLKSQKRGQMAHWKKVDRYVKNRLPGVLRGASVRRVIDARTEGFNQHTFRCAYALTLFLMAACYYNRGWLKRFNKKRCGDLWFTDLNAGLCGLYAWVTSMSWERIRKPYDPPCNMVVFPSALSVNRKLCNHAMVFHDGLFYDANPEFAYDLKQASVSPESKHEHFELMKISDSDGEVGYAIVINPGDDIGKNWARGNWFPWSTRRARRLVDVIVNAYKETLNGGVACHDDEEAEAL